MKRVKTWIDGLDDVLEGGLPNKSVILFIGEPGSGYELLAKQIMYYHAAKDGKVTYFSTNRSPEVLREDFGAFGWEIQPLEESGRWVFEKDLKEIPLRIEQNCWTVVDSLSYLFLTQKLKSVLDLVESLLDSAQKYGGIHLILLTHGMQDAQTETTMGHLADGIMEFLAQEVGGTVDRRIRIKKMAKAVYAQRLIPFHISEHGIVVETAIRIA
jgi:KaiC/GvpD/RAD55 family RecA-like ATPase